MTQTYLQNRNRLSDIENKLMVTKKGTVAWDNGEGNGNPLQCPCLENPRDGGAWGAAVYGLAQSWTRLK